ncbi:MAG: hypothetical protein E6J18_03745 [Chloroflexi bacterium]|nr:MAG: hypothetical protein E6J37_02165 [Chloroflexota bacterium]TMC73039.1 MAG: hypothetical protein E6J18_03745 [Chloroflexota bacterium]
MPTGWTRPLQYSVVAWYLIQAIYAITLPFLMAGPMADYFNQVIQQQARLSPNTTPPPAEFLSMMTTVMTWSLAIGAAIGVAISAVAIIGALRRWTWVFYVVLVLLGLQTISFPFTVISAFASSTLNPVKLPTELTASSVALGIPAIALFVWMLIAAIRRGPWAMRRAG